MNIEQANQIIQQTVDQLNLDYGGCLFDEWALVEFRKGKSDLLLYSGPRKASFLTQLPTDMAALSHSFRDGTLLQLGEYDFARNATGSQIDAAACVGKNIYLLFNNMTVAMADICKNERWLGAQQTFFSLCERFRSDPVSLTHQM